MPTTNVDNIGLNKSRTGILTVGPFADGIEKQIYATATNAEVVLYTVPAGMNFHLYSLAVQFYSGVAAARNGGVYIRNAAAVMLWRPVFWGSNGADLYANFNASFWPPLILCATDYLSVHSNGTQFSVYCSASGIQIVR